jgi:predicted DCC family thiol-disulfide oxidoreductase YuxK
MKKLWNRLFLDERPSIGLSFFRIFVALTTGLHVIPSFFHLEDNYFPTAFKELNGSFFPYDFLLFIQKSPESLIVFFVILFCVSCFCFLVGLLSQLSCIIMTACCYFFYALNSIQIGTLSWDILLVTLFLMCLTPYHGDYFSVDALYSCDAAPWKRPRPYFIQRLLQIQISSTFFYTALYKVTAQGNWLTANPVYYLMHNPPSGVVKSFLLRDFLAMHPAVCYWIGIFIIVMEFTIGFCWFIERTRVPAIYLGFLFHIMLILTLDVPAIFFFLFPAQMLLFINSQHIVRWIEMKRAYHARAPRAKIIYDGHCRFCRESVRKLKVMDLYGTLEYVDFQSHPDLTSLHPLMTKEKAKSEVFLIEPDGSLFGGFFAFRRLCLTLPMLYPMAFIMYLPGAAFVGSLVYKWIAGHRYLLHVNRKCEGAVSDEASS